VDTLKTPRRSGPGWIVWLTAVLLIGWIVLGFVSGWQLIHVLGIVAMALLLAGFLRQVRQPRGRAGKAGPGRSRRRSADGASSSEETP
jgi:hypothetical protein